MVLVFALFYIINGIFHAEDDGFLTLLVFLDYSKAFETLTRAVMEMESLM